MEAMRFERLDQEGLWISEGGDPDTRLFLSMEKRNDMPQFKGMNISMDEKKGKARTTGGAVFDIDM